MPQFSAIALSILRAASLTEVRPRLRAPPFMRWASAAQSSVCPMAAAATISSIVLALVVSNSSISSSTLSLPIVPRRLSSIVASIRMCLPGRSSGAVSPATARAMARDRRSGSIGLVSTSLMPLSR